MINDLTFRVADTCFRLVFKDIEDARPLLPSYAPFYLKAGEFKDEEITMTMHIGDGVDFNGIGTELGQFDCGDNKFGVYRKDDGGYKILISEISGQKACALLTSSDFSQCEASLYGGDNQQRFGLNNALMIAFAFSGAHHNIILMHASVPFYKGYAYLFLGKSGTGKSTHSSLWLEHIEGTDLLNDDNPAVRVLPDGTVKAYGTPWSGKTPCYRNLSFPLGAFLRLEQYPENIIRRENLLQSFASVLSSCSTMVWDKPSYDAILNTITEIVKTTPCFYLKNLPNEEAARLSNSTICRNE